MRLTRKTNQYRRDFTGRYQCEHCGHEQTSNGYDDAHFHNHVIPAMRCKNCDLTAAPDTPHTSPDVPADAII